jgi:cytochrome c biogenesis protein CcdA/glutaredoxin
MDVLLADIPVLEQKYDFTLKKYDIDLMSNYRLLERMEEAAGTTGEDLPVIFIGDSVFYGPEGLAQRLDHALRRHRRPAAETRPSPVTAGKDLPEVSLPAPAQVIGPPAGITVEYFYQPGCPECGRLEALFDNLEREHAGIRVARYNILLDTCKILLEARAEKAGMDEGLRLIAPVVFIGHAYLIKEQITSGNILELVARAGPDAEPIDQTALEAAGRSIAERFGRFTLLGIAAAGLLDGVNPCAFATIVFFVSYLVFLGRRRRDIVTMAVAFIAAVFIVYFAIGIGAYKLLEYLTGFDIIARVIFMCFGVFALVLGVLSLRDFFLARKGQTDRMLLQLPLGIKQRIHRDIKERTAVGSIVFGSFVAGFIVSVLEFGCTGQIYLPTITFMISKAGLQVKPVFALLLYNLMFVLPLIVIALVAVVFTTRAVGRALSAKIPAVKLLTALLFFGLGIVLILFA